MISDAKLLALVIPAWVASWQSCNAAVSPSFLSKVEQIESRGVSSAVGDNGRARGLYQFHFNNWLDCSEWRAARGLKVYPYQMATNPAIAREYAKTSFEISRAYLVASGIRPTRELLLACHQCGIQGVKRRNFDLRKVPKTTKKALARL